MLIAERGENNRYVTEAMKGWFTSIRCSTDMVLYNIIIDTFMYYVVIYTHMYYARRFARSVVYVYIYVYMYMYIYIYVYVYSGVERSERHRRGEASSLSFIFRPIQETTDLSRVTLSSLTRSRSGPAKYRWRRFSRASLATQRNSSLEYPSRFHLDELCAVRPRRVSFASHSNE